MTARIFAVEQSSLSARRTRKGGQHESLLWGHTVLLAQSKCAPTAFSAAHLTPGVTCGLCWGAVAQHADAGAELWCVQKNPLAFCQKTSCTLTPQPGYHSLPKKKPVSLLTIAPIFTKKNPCAFTKKNHQVRKFIQEKKPALSKVMQITLVLPQQNQPQDRTTVGVGRQISAKGGFGAGCFKTVPPCLTHLCTVDDLLVLLVSRHLEDGLIDQA